MWALLGKMMAARLSPKTIVNHAQVVKLVVASAVNNEGEQIYPRTCNHDFIGLPSLTTQSSAVRRSPKLNSRKSCRV
jgi:hypothetical protein